MDKFIIILLIIGLMVLYMIIKRIYWGMRSDNGYNMGRNHMHDLGFDDNDIDRGKDDVDKDLYVFRGKDESTNSKEK